MEETAQYLSQEKREELKTELTRLKTVDRKEVAEHLEYAKSLGDLSENAEYHEARDRQADIEDRINQIEEILKNVVIISAHGNQAVQVGSTVTVKKNGGAEQIYLVVGPEEANLMASKISYKSPIGAALLGRKKGEEVKVSTPRGEASYIISSIK